MRDEETYFDKFLQASSLDRFNIQQFSRQLNNYDSDNKELILEYPAQPIQLPKVKNKLNNLAKNRKSERKFSNKKIKSKEFSSILSSFYAVNGLEHRYYPSAGATYATEIFCLNFNVENFGNNMYYYDPQQHGVVLLSVDKAPNWQEASKSLNISVEGTPGLLIIFVTFPSRATAKYGERGGRFALLEIGAAMQQLSLNIAATPNIKGVAVGGMIDEVWKQYLNLTHTDAVIALGYLVGK